ncbi:F-box/kelch-repeat protein At3g23880-like [Vicia villosa]|uniref:F-box/kelch-repeat protein At3g23880-like n=1 Tax=Vicia villosa TaxID=3911 RepID=UPI00273A86B5|nr:F-box/kelch-repeat protein At3g23880-like [Vicia villosa]
MEILLRLPVKTVLRCRCVCKSWLSLISDPNFATSHFQFALSPPTHKLVFLEKFPDAPEIISINFDASLNDDSSYSSLSLDFFSFQSCCEIIGSCRGFLFLHCNIYFYLWNPSTGVNKNIPASPITIYSNDHLFITHLYGFGYDPSTDDYLVVFGFYEYHDPADSSIDLAIFSLRANKWKQIESGSHFPYKIFPKGGYDPRAGLLLNETIHWLVYNCETSRYAIIAFDLKETRMSEIALPDEFIFSLTNTSFIEYDLLVLGGLISVWNVEKYTIEIWVMQEYKVHSSWTKTLNFSFFPAPDFSPLCFTKCGDIVGTVRGGGLVKLNDKGLLLEHHAYGNYYFNRSQMTLYTESLLSLPSGT